MFGKVATQVGDESGLANAALGIRDGDDHWLSLVFKWLGWWRRKACGSSPQATADRRTQGW